MRVKGFFFIWIAFGLWACGSKLNQPSQVQGVNAGATPTPTPSLIPAAVSTTDQLLVGNWILPCQPDPKRNRLFVEEYLQFDHAEMNRNTIWYTDSQCENALYQQNVRADYLYSQSGVYSETRKEIAILPQSVSSVRMLNSYTGFCDTRRWKLNEEIIFTDVVRCGVERVKNFKIEAKRGVNNFAELVVRQCEKRNPENCFDLTYRR